MKISRLYGTQIESKDKKIRGHILGITCVNNTIDGYICCNERQKEFFARGENCTFKKGVLRFDQTGKRAENSEILRLNRAVFAKNGKFVGVLQDCTVQGNVIASATVSKRKIPFNRIIVGDVFILDDEIAGAEIAAKDMFIDALTRR